LGAARSDLPIMQPSVASIPSYSDVSAQPPAPVSARRRNSASADAASRNAAPEVLARTSTSIGPGRWAASWVQKPARASTSSAKSSTSPAAVRLGRQRA
jgi:hypothetical protein